jgi:hypothetical protein
MSMRFAYALFRRFFGNMLREFRQRFSAFLHGTLGSHLREPKGGQWQWCCMMSSCPAE